MSKRNAQVEAVRRNVRSLVSKYRAVETEMVAISSVPAETFKAHELARLRKQLEELSNFLSKAKAQLVKLENEANV